MNILIVEGDKQFLEVATQAAKNYLCEETKVTKEHRELVISNTSVKTLGIDVLVKKKRNLEFFFTRDPHDALTLIRMGAIDAVITRFFFIKSNEIDAEDYYSYVKAYDQSCETTLSLFKDWCLEWDHRDLAFRYNKVANRIEANRSILMKDKLPAYGGLIMLECYKRGIKVVLWDDILHRKRERGLDRPLEEYGILRASLYGSDGILILSPFIALGMLLVTDLTTSHDNKCNFHEISGHDTDPWPFSKDKETNWKIVIKNLLSQPAISDKAISERKAKLQKLLEA